MDKSSFKLNFNHCARLVRAEVIVCLRQFGNTKTEARIRRSESDSTPRADTTASTGQFRAAFCKPAKNMP